MDNFALNVFMGVLGWCFGFVTYLFLLLTVAVFQRSPGVLAVIWRFRVPWATLLAVYTIFVRLGYIRLP